jgi:hypothetical protein
VPDRGARAARVNNSPYLSVVVTARNDDHGGNLAPRMQAFVNGLLSQCRRHRVPAELVMVEWNPPPDRPPLAEALDWSAQNEFCAVRIIEVPPALHRRFRYGHALPLYQMIAKNVGIRRARGEFILATNIDILFSDELFEILAARALKPGKMYRADRWDVMAELPADQPIDQQLAWCNSHLLRVNRREGTFALNPDGSMKIDADDIVRPERGITLGENWFPRELSGGEPFRWVENDAEFIIGQAGEVFLSLDVEPGPGVDVELFPLEVHNAAGAVLASTVVERRSTVSLALQLAAPDTHVFLHTDYGGAKIAADLRILNFRVFRCDLTVGKPATAVAVRPTGGRLGRLRRGVGVLAKSFFSASDVRIPMSKAAMERLNLRQDESAVSFILGPLLRARPNRNGVIGGGLVAIWERGWNDLERFRGEAFRWMQREGTVILILPESGGSHVSILAEAGPSVGFRGARLEVRDDSGALLAGAELRGRTTLDVPIADLKGAAVLHLSVSGSTAPSVVPGDSRTLALRLIRCELFPPAAPLEPANPFEAASGLGVWCVRGFKSRDAGLLCATQAELAVRAADSIALQVSPNASRQSTPAHLSIRDASGNVLHDGDVSPNQEIAIPSAAASGCTLLRFTANRPVIFRSAIRAVPNQPPVQYRLGADISPVPLHTNGCGDFTMLARRHWVDLRGYPEFDAFSMNIDSVLCWAAHHGGAREEMLPTRIFHIEHGTGSGWTPEGEQKLYQRILAKGLPWLDFKTVLEWARAMNRFDVPLIFNSEDWGLNNETLPEVTPGPNACQHGKV